MIFVLLACSPKAFALSRSPMQAYPVVNNNKQYEVYELSANFGQLTDGTWVKLVCIRKGMLGMPNISMPSYRGKYTNKNGETCYVFVAEPDGTITYKNQKLNVYRMDDNQGFLSDGTKVTIECLPSGAVAKIAATSQYRGTYYLQDARGNQDKQQCHVYAVEDTIKTSGLRSRGTGFRS